MLLKNLSKQTIKVRVGEQLFEWQPDQELELDSQLAVQVLQTLHGQLFDPDYTLDEQLTQEELKWIRDLAWGMMRICQLLAKDHPQLAISNLALWFSDAVASIERKMSR